MYPREDPGVKDDDLNSSMREWEEKLLGEMERLDQEMTPLNMKVSQEEPDRSLVNFKSQEETTESEINHEATQIDTISLLGNFEVTQNPEFMHGNANHIALLGQLDIADSEHKLSQDDQNRFDQTVPKINDGEHQEDDVVSSVNKKTDMESKNYLSNQQPLPGQKEVLALEKSMHSSDQEVKPLTDTAADYHTDKVTSWEDDYIWFLWNTYSTISVIYFLYRYLRRNSQSHTNNSTSEDTKIFNVRNFSADVKLPDNDILHQFYNKCVRVSSSESGRIGDFVEGIANDLLEAMRNMPDKKVGMAMKDFEVVEAACGSGVCKIIIPFLPLEPHGFQFQLWNGQAGGMPQDRGPQSWYRIKMVGGVNNCPCGSSNKGGDLLCLLHCEEESVGEMTAVFDNPLCQRNTPYLSRVKVKQWFQNEIRRAWENISHKYELTFSYKDSTATVTVRFRSGKIISFQMAPVVKLPDTEAYFAIAPCSTTKATSETIWSPSLTIYENRFLKHLEKGFPKLSCHIQSLNIVLFLNEKQTVLTGRSALKYQHYKTALMHLLASKEPADWHPENLASRIRDLLSFVEKSLHQRILHQIRLRTPIVPKEVEMPSAIYETTPVNILHPLLVQNDIFIKTIQHFQEMLKNTPMLIQEYLSSK